MWIARDEDGSLWLYSDKPIRDGDMWVYDNPDTLLGYVRIDVPNLDMPEVTLENSPKELIIKPEENGNN